MTRSQLISSPYPNLKVMPKMEIAELRREDDVERRPENALKMAVLERELGVTSRMKSTDDVIGR